MISKKKEELWQSGLFLYLCQLEKWVNSFKEKLQSQQHNMAGLKAYRLIKCGRIEPLRLLMLDSSARRNENNKVLVTTYNLDP